MLDIKFVRENVELVKENIRKKFQDHKLPLVDEAIELDTQIRNIKFIGDELRAKRNAASNEIGALMREKKKEEAMKIKESVVEETGDQTINRVEVYNVAKMVTSIYTYPSEDITAFYPIDKIEGYSSSKVYKLCCYSWYDNAEKVELVYKTDDLTISAFNKVYKNYNDLQKDQGFNLEKYKGKTVEIYTYSVYNYDGYEDKDCIKCNLLVCDVVLVRMFDGYRCASA